MPFLLGTTGRWKTALARLVCQLYGHFDDEGDLLSWASTYASWETHSHMLKDMLLILDDFKRGTTDARQVTKFIQHYRDSTGRQRRRTDLSALPSKRARCIVLATGEDAPQLQPSVAARLLYIPVGPGALAQPRLDAAQETIGDLHGLTPDFLAWLAGAHEVQTTLGTDFRPRRKAAMAELGPGTNVGRVAENVVMLSLAWETLGRYLGARGWLDGAALSTLQTVGLQAILGLGAQQLRLIDSQSPDRIFLDVLQGLIYSGEVSLHTKDGLPSGKGPVVGYSDGECIALYSGQSEGGTGLVAFHKVVEHLARANQRFEHDWAAVGEYLRTNGWLLKYDKKHLTTTKSIQGTVRRVLLLKPEALIVPPRAEEKTSSTGAQETAL
jgi:hypothetical protein